MGTALHLDMLQAIKHCPPHRQTSPLAVRLRQRALELAAEEGLGRASFTFRILRLERVEGPLLKVNGERLEAPWLLPSSGSLTALACGVCTLGEGLEERVRTLFSEGSRSLAMALDSLGNELLLEASKHMHHRLLLTARRRGLTVSGELRSGDPGLALDTQPTVLRLAKAEQVGVSASSGAVMHPLKSTSGVFGVGIDLPKAHWSRCDTCRSRERCAIARAA